MKKKLSPNLIKLVSLLSDGKCHNGSDLGAVLGMTRTAVWKTIKKLASDDVNIHSVKGKGYVLSEPLILLELHKIKKKLIHDQLDISLFGSIDSTNNYLRTIKQPTSIKICLAEKQTNGKGRLHRKWHSPFGKNIYLSCLFPFQKDISELAGLSLITSLAIIKTLKDCGIKQGICVKWPNDILYENKKISGTLVEIQAESHGASHAIIGIGINVNMQKDEHEHAISQDWIAMGTILEQYLDRNDVVARLINHLIHYLHQFDAKGFSLFMNEWIQSDCLMNQIITVNNLHHSIKGKVQGINEQGHLLLQLEDGSIKAFSSGDTSIVKNVKK